MGWRRHCMNTPHCVESYKVGNHQIKSQNTVLHVVTVASNSRNVTIFSLGVISSGTSTRLIFDTHLYFIIRVTCLNELRRAHHQSIEISPTHSIIIKSHQLNLLPAHSPIHTPSPAITQDIMAPNPAQSY